MSHATGDGAALAAAIRADPTDDTVRLAYADWLDEQPVERVRCPHCMAGLSVKRCHRCHQVVADEREHHSGEDYDGTWFCDRAPRCPVCAAVGTVPDRRLAARAEFIRVQCELARTDPNTLTSPNHETTRDPRCPCRYCVLSRRADELFDRYRSDWLRVRCPACDGTGKVLGASVYGYSREKERCDDCLGTGDAGGLTWTFTGIDAATVTPAGVKFHRGFPAVITVPRFSDLIVTGMTGCPDCIALAARPGPGGAAQPRCGRYDGGVVRTCAPTAWLRTVTAHHPIERAIPYDRLPYWNGEAYAWYRAERRQPSHLVPSSAELPGPLFAVIADAAMSVGTHRWKGASTFDRARDLLGRAIVATARH